MRHGRGHVGLEMHLRGSRWFGLVRYRLHRNGNHITLYGIRFLCWTFAVKPPGARAAATLVRDKDYDPNGPDLEFPTDFANVMATLRDMDR